MIHGNASKSKLNPHPNIPDWTSPRLGGGNWLSSMGATRFLASIMSRPMCSNVPSSSGYRCNARPTRQRSYSLLLAFNLSRQRLTSHRTSAESWNLARVAAARSLPLKMYVGSKSDTTPEVTSCPTQPGYVSPHSSLCSGHLCMLAKAFQIACHPAFELLNEDLDENGISTICTIRPEKCDITSATLRNTLEAGLAVEVLDYCLL